MSLSNQIIADLTRGPAYSFADWPNPLVPKFGAGVYTIWHKDGRFIYVGMSGRGMTAETRRRNTPQGTYTRLQSHASGRRSGDQFCVYVADRLVLPTLSQEPAPQQIFPFSAVIFDLGNGTALPPRELLRFH
jgi:hypothetical protein